MSGLFKKVEPYRVEIRYPIVPVNKCNYLQVEVYYSLGGMNYFSGRSESRGYYLSISPIEVGSVAGGNLISYTAFTGYKFLLFESGRKSKSGMDKAIKMFEETHMDYVKKYFSSYEIIQNQD